MLSDLQKRILEISYKHKLSHLGSSLSCLKILEHIYEKRMSNEPVILSCGHAALALYCVLEKYENQDAENLIEVCGVHPVKNKNLGIWCSTGSLGMGITVAVGRALADPKRNVWCVISDGEMYEGAVYESLMFVKENNIKNLRIFLNHNEYGAYKSVKSLFPIDCFPCVEVISQSIESLKIPFLSGQDAHYYTMNEQDWKWVQKNYEKTI